MTSVRVYTLLTPGQKAELETLAKKQDRSVSYLIARAIDQFVNELTRAVGHTRADASEKVFTRTTLSAAVDVKKRATLLECHDWQVVNTAIENYLELNSDALCDA